MSTSKRKSNALEMGWGSVLADLGLRNAHQLLSRAQLAFHVLQFLDERKLKKRGIGGILGIAKSDALHLTKWTWEIS